MSKHALLVANWKLNHDRKTAGVFIDAILANTLPEHISLAIAPVMTMLDFVGEKLSRSKIALAAQNVFYADSGAFTGECSAMHLKEVGVRYCIIGHSERRVLFHESDVDVGKKAHACLRAGLVPIVCVGESRDERVGGETFNVITRQLDAAFHDDVGAHEIIIAYEPVWAIGTGLTASAGQIDEVHGFIAQMARQAGKLNLRIIYGGSVNPQNIEEIMAISHVDGALIGGASLQAESFLSMVQKLQRYSSK